MMGGHDNDLEDDYVYELRWARDYQSTPSRYARKYATQRYNPRNGPSRDSVANHPESEIEVEDSLLSSPSSPYQTPSLAKPNQRHVTFALSECIPQSSPGRISISGGTLSSVGGSQKIIKDHSWKDTTLCATNYGVINVNILTGSGDSMEEHKIARTHDGLQQKARSPNYHIPKLRFNSRTYEDLQQQVHSRDCQIDALLLASCSLNK